MRQPIIPILAGLSAALITTTLSGCADNPHKASTSAYYHDAHICRAQNLIQPKVRSNLASDASSDIVAGVNARNYLKCMEQLGYHQDVKTDPLLHALDKCQHKAERPLTATPEGSGTKLSASLDRAAFRECLKQRGVEGEVEVGPLENLEPK
ncbi:hypothetical protein [Methylomagnum sp.]